MEQPPHDSLRALAPIRRRTGWAAPQGQTGTLLLFLTPYLAGTFLLIAAPAMLTFALAFTRYDALSPPVWRGMQNFEEIFKSPLFWTAARNSLAFVAFAVPLRVLGAGAGAAAQAAPARSGGLASGGLSADCDPQRRLCADLGMDFQPDLWPA